LDAGEEGLGIGGEVDDFAGFFEGGDIGGAEDDAATGGDDEVIFFGGFGDDGGFEVAEGGFALGGEDFLDGAAGAFDEEGVGIDEVHPEFLGEAFADGGFARTAVADEGEVHGGSEKEGKGERVKGKGEKGKGGVRWSGWVLMGASYAIAGGGGEMINWGCFGVCSGERLGV
jgi:hypothetical protein